MRRLLNRAITLGVLTAAGYVLYTYGLSDAAKTGIKNAARSVKRAYEQVSETVAAAQGQVMPDEGPLPNQQSTAQQWESLGF